jgi:hypothetical protein
MIIDAIYPQDPYFPIADRFIGKEIDNERMERIKDRDWTGYAILQEDVLVEKEGVEQKLSFGKGCKIFLHWVRLITLEEAEIVKKGGKLQ